MGGTAINTSIINPKWNTISRCSSNLVLRHNKITKPHSNTKDSGNIIIVISGYVILLYTPL